MNVCVTGGNGFFGRHLVKKLQEQGYAVSAPTSKSFDLRTEWGVFNLLCDSHFDVVIHAAAYAGGIGLNQQKPADLFYDNIMMGTQMIHYAVKFGVKKFVQIGTVCAYPKWTPTPFKEEDLWNGYPEDTNAPYGIAKKALLVQGQAYRQQYGLNFIYLLPVNMYGPGDHFEPSSSHVIPALIRKFTEAKQANLSEVTLWGTGKASREFLYVEDCAKAVVMALEHYDKPEPVNIGTGREITISELAEGIASLIGYKGLITYDTSRPDGQPRRCLDTSRAKEFGFTAETSLYDGLKKTIEWYNDRP